jgi:HD-GYP domain-containing protein (c-di-GMP phosphodiesterase class II)
MSDHPTLARWHAWQQLADALERLLLAPQLAADFPLALREVTQQIDDLMSSDTDLGMFEVVRISPDKLARYGALHSLHTACVVWLVAHRKEWTVAKRMSALQAALTMNIAVTDLQTILAQQAGPMDADQQSRIHNHALDSERLLRSLGVSDELWLTAVAEHHEQPGCKGYPRGLPTTSELADLLRTCDVFCAKMSPRAGRTAMLSPKAAEAIFRHRSANFFGATVVTTMGLYPPGSLVTLGSGEQAMVTERTQNPLRPIIALLTDTEGQALDAPQASGTDATGARKVVGPAASAAPAQLFPPTDVLKTR